ncbi:GNAT family N-acetyltransferase [soil metagenome]
MPVEVRRIAAHDWLLLRDLRLASLADAPEAFGQRHEEAAKTPDEEWQQTARASTEGKRRAWFLARDGEGEVVGLVQARRRTPADCLLFSMWVTPAARGGGVGRALVEAVADWGATWGAQRVVLWVYGANRGAQQFYERLGFTLMPEGPDAESGAAFGALALELPLTV